MAAPTDTANGDSKTAYSFGNPPPMGSTTIAAMFGVPAAPEPRLPMRQFRGDSLQQPFKMRDRLKQKEPLIGYAMGLPSPDIARLIGSSGCDLCFIDWEHTPMGIKELTELIRWVQLSGEGTCAAVVRLPSHDHHWIAWALDAGASAVVLPHTDTPEQAKAAVAAARFSSEGGHRSYPPFSMIMGYNDGDLNGALPWDIYNRGAVICQLESGTAAMNAQEIAKVPGVDGLMIGHADLRASMGFSMANDGDEPEYVKAVDQILTAARENGDLPVLSFCMGAASIEKRRKQGYRMFMVGADGITLSAGMRHCFAEAHEALKKAEESK